LNACTKEKCEAQCRETYKATSNQKDCECPPDLVEEEMVDKSNPSGWWCEGYQGSPCPKDFEEYFPP